MRADKLRWPTAALATIGETMELFKSPKMAAAPKPPSIDDARMNLDVRKSLAGRKGRASNIIAGGEGSTDSGKASGPATKVLLGN